jgi:hypothetical protein
MMTSAARWVVDPLARVLLRQSNPHPGQLIAARLPDGQRIGIK